MQQLTQQLKDGTMQVLDVPYPAVRPGEVLVRNRYSLISAGTEGKTVTDARMGYVAKARARREEVRQVVDSVRNNGLTTTLQRVSNKLETPSGLGYSSAGVVIAAGPETGFRAGDRVACAGATAVHAEVVAVPKNLCVRIDDGVDFKQAAFAAVASVALQGVRQAELQVGSNCVVIGLGLVGLLTVQFLQAGGIRAAGIDISEEAIRRAEKLGAAAFLVSDSRLKEKVLDFSHGAGADAVIICAGAKSTEPVNLAGELCRQKGRVVVVGNVPTGFARRNYYRKELDLRMSCSYGPGRYDAQYEDHGQDYPIGYVRWTENRNMQAFVDLLADQRLDLSTLITHVFPIDRAPEAYDLIVDGAEPYVGILLEYDEEGPAPARVIRTNGRSPRSIGKPRIGCIGAGSFAQNVLLPALKNGSHLSGVVTGRPNHARHAMDRFGFDYCTGDASDLINDREIDAVFITTRHDSHAAYVIDALRSGKDVYVEKPLCLTREELEEIREAYAESDRRLMVGFNRRFAPHVQMVKEQFNGDCPVAIHYRIHASKLPADHWVHDPKVGGGRILGEVCHFIDLAQFLGGSPIASVSAAAMHDPMGLQDSVALTLSLANGSVASIGYFSDGSGKAGKERLEISGGGRTAIIDDFKKLKVYGDRSSTDRLLKQDKGHQNEMDAFLKALHDGAPAPIPFSEIDNTTRASFAVLDSLRSGQTISLSHG